MKEDKPAKNNAQPAASPPMFDKKDKVLAAIILAGTAAVPIGRAIYNNNIESEKPAHVSTDTGLDPGTKIALGGAVTALAAAVPLYLKSRRRLRETLESKGIDPKGRIL